MAIWLIHDITYVCNLIQIDVSKYEVQKFNQGLTECMCVTEYRMKCFTELNKKRRFNRKKCDTSLRFFIWALTVFKPKSIWPKPQVNQNRKMLCGIQYIANLTD